MRLFLANFCLQQTPPNKCSCYNNTVTFVRDYPALLQRQFFETQALILDTSPEFCSTASDRMCDSFVENNTCCCGEDVQIYRKCLFDKVLVPAVPRLQAAVSNCTDSCDYKTYHMDNGNNNLGPILGGVAGGILLMIFCYVGSKRFMEQRSESDNNESFCNNRSPNPPPMTLIDLEGGLGSKGTGTAHHDKEIQHHDQRVEPVKRFAWDSDSDESFEEEEVPLKDAVPSNPGSRQGSRRQLPASPPQECAPHNETMKSVGATLSSSEVSLVAQQQNAAFNSDKAMRLRKRKQMIHNWIEERRQGSNRSLEDYISDEEEAKNDSMSSEQEETMGTDNGDGECASISGSFS